MILCIQRIACAFVLLLAAVTSAASQTWSGDWDTNFGQLRLIQQGQRLYGDYADRGTIEGRITDNGRTARAVFLYNDGRWGTVQWSRAQDRLAGTWNWAADGLPQAKSGKIWTGTRASARTSPLKFARFDGAGYPITDVTFVEGAFREWLGEAKGPNPSVVPVSNPRSGTGTLYGGYDALQTDGLFDINVDVIDFAGTRAASADIGIFKAPGRGCPQAAHTAFCTELNSLVDNRGYVTVTTTGAQIVRSGPSLAVEIAFRLPGDRRDRMMVIGREATYFQMLILHPKRGYDFVGYAQGRPHVCETDQCTNDAFIDLRNNPDRNIGKFLETSWNSQMRALPNAIAQSHQANVQPAPLPTPARPVGPAGQFDDPWVILDETSQNLGTVSIKGDLRITGELRDMFTNGGPSQTTFTLMESTNQAAAWDLVTYAGGSGEQKSGRLMLELPGSTGRTPRGTLVMGDDVFLIELVRPIPGLDPSDVGDLPAIGVSGPMYGLRDVPSDRTVILRRQPDRNSGEAGRLSPFISGLTVQTCTPEIYTQDFEETDRQGKLRLLSTAWCQVIGPEFAGWLPGRYLDPQ